MSNVYVYVEDDEVVRAEPPDQLGCITVQLGDGAFLRLRHGVAAELYAALGGVIAASAEQDGDV